MNKHTNRVVWLVLFCFGIQLIGADHIVFETVTPAHEIMGQQRPETKSKTHLWLDGTKAVSENSAQKTIIDFEKGVANFILHGAQAYVPMKMPIDFWSYLPDMVREMSEKMKPTVSVVATEETKEILGTTCKVYELTFASSLTTMTSKVYATEKPPFDYSNFANQFEDAFNSLKFPMLDREGLDKVKEVKGFIMGLEMTMDLMGTAMTSSTYVTSIAKEDLPKDAFVIPADYKEYEKLPQAAMGQR